MHIVQPSRALHIHRAAQLLRLPVMKTSSKRLSSNRILTCALALFLLFVPQLASADTFQGRPLIIYDGRGNDAAPATTLIVMHGYLGTSRYMQRKTKLNALARRHGLVLVYPNGEGRKWNDGRSPGNPTDDIGYLAALAESLVARGLSQPGRIFFAGHSNGGGMAMRMACDRPDLVRGIAVVATKVPTNYQCANGAKTPAIFFYGTDDPISPHSGRTAGSRLGAALSAEKSLALWQQRNGCTGAPNSQTVDRRDDGTSAEIMSFKGCAAALVAVIIAGHGHDWPKPGSRPTRLQGAASQEIDASALIWQFFSGL